MIIIKGVNKLECKSKGHGGGGNVIVQKSKYIHHNPVQEKWKLCKLPEDYKYSSAAYYYIDKKDWDFITHYLEFGM